jgi:hypothetical protein
MQALQRQLVMKSLFGQVFALSSLAQPAQKEDDSDIDLDELLEGKLASK